MPLTAVVALSLVSLAGMTAYRNERLGSAVLVGCGVLAAFYLLVGAQEAKREATQAPSAPTVSVTTSGPFGGDPSRSDDRPWSLPSGT